MSESPAVNRRLTGGLLTVCVSLAGCSSGSIAASPRDAGPSDAGPSDATTDTSVRDSGHPSDRVLPPDIDAMPPPGAFCALPGSVVFTAQGPEIFLGNTCQVYYPVVIGPIDNTAIGWL